jgi:hypothetical protein
MLKAVEEVSDRAILQMMRYFNLWYFSSLCWTYVYVEGDYWCTPRLHGQCLPHHCSMSVWKVHSHLRYCHTHRKLPFHAPNMWLSRQRNWHATKQCWLKLWLEVYKQLSLRHLVALHGRAETEENSTWHSDAGDQLGGEGTENNAPLYVIFSWYTGTIGVGKASKTIMKGVLKWQMWSGILTLLIDLCQVAVTS